MQIPTIKEILKKNKIKIHKSLGQNFIFDQNLTDKIVSKSKPLCNTIIEIGPVWMFDTINIKRKARKTICNRYR